MALVIHIALALLLYWLRTSISSSRLRRRAKPLTAGRLVEIYLSSLVSRVVIPYALAELACRALLVPHAYSSFILLLPHFYMLLIRREILAFIQQSLFSKK